jgi:ABC-type branched-subunit amino acid transport system substrate-binding protein
LKHALAADTVKFLSAALFYNSGSFIVAENLQLLSPDIIILIMFRLKIFPLEILIIFPVWFCLSCRSENGNIQTHKFVIGIAGDGVPGNCVADNVEREYPLNRAQGRAMWEGVEAAFQYSGRLADLRDKVELRPCDDRGVGSQAAAVAATLRSDPRTVAVIGHATSGTTRKAAPLYWQADIPVVMPIATSPNVSISADGGQHLNDLFRLPPSDDLAQAPAVAEFALKKLQRHKIYVVRDISVDAKEYSSPLFTKILKEIGDSKIDYIQVDRKEASIHEIAANVHAQNADLVIFVGYGTTANLILSDLRDRYQALKELPPAVILTDGCKIEDLNTDGLEVYLSFPLPDFSSLSCQTDDFSILEKHAQDRSYEMYGYDAMLILGDAIHACDKLQEISRECIRRTLASGRSFTGACLTYRFTNGENFLSRTYIYRVTKNAAGRAQYTQVMEITKNELGGN